MKKILLSIVAILLVASTQLSALTLVHYWNFNGTNIPLLTEGTSKDVVVSPLTSIQTDLSLTATAGSLIYQAIPGTVSAMSYWDTSTGATGNARNGDAAGNCLRPRDAWTNMQLVLSIPTTGYNNPQIMYDIQRSGSGPSVNTYFYSVDGGTNWITTGLSTLTNTVVIPSTGFLTQTVTITNPLANNNAKLQFKILFSDPVNKAGNNRIDNITVEGTAVGGTTGIEENKASNQEITMSPNITRNGVVNFSEVVDAVVFNLQGKQIKSVANTNNLNTVGLAKGIYIVRLNSSVSKKLIIE